MWRHSRSGCAARCITSSSPTACGAVSSTSPRLVSEKLGRKYADRNAKLCSIISELARGMSLFSSNGDTLGDAYEYLIGQFAAGSGKKAGEFYTPQQISSILSGIVTLDSQDPKTGPRKKLNAVFDFACGSGSLLLNVRHRMTASGGTIGQSSGWRRTSPPTIWHA